VASSPAAAKRDPAVSVPPPLSKKGSNNKTAPSSSSRNQQYASRKSPPEPNVAAVITKSPTNSVTAAASTLIYQKNDVDGNSGGKEGRTKLYDSEDLEENECNASGSNEDDGSFILEENESDAASGVEEDKLVAPEGLVYSDDEAYLFEVESEDEFRTSFPKDVSRKNIIPGGPPKPDVRGMTKAKAEIVLKAYAKDRKAVHASRQFSLFLICLGIQVTTVRNCKP